MDSITHLFLGGAIAAAIAPAKYRRSAMVFGAAINSLPDLDVLPLALWADDPVVNMTWHRGATHSMLLMPFVAWCLWRLLKERWALVRENPRRGLWLILVTLLAHPFVDAFTVYGTQWLWPLPVPPAMWSSVFIIDPLFTLPLLLGCVVAWFAREKPMATKALVLGLVLAATYLGWSLLAKAMVERAAGQSLAKRGLQDAPRFSVPTPFNTLLWRVVVMTPDGFLEGERSLVADHGPMPFRAYASDVHALAQVRHYPAVSRLLWFNHGYMKAEQRGNRLLLSDLRMGAEPDYSFRFAVAERDAGGWREIPVEQLQWPWQASRRLPAVWRRIWARDAPDPPTEGATP